MTSITSDALRMALVLDMEEGQYFEKIQRVNAAHESLKKKAEDLQNTLAMQKLEVEARFDPEKKLELEFERVYAIVQKLNLGLDTQNKLLDEVFAKHAKDTTPSWMISGGNPIEQQDAHIQKIKNDQKKLNDDILAERARFAAEAERYRQSELSAEQRFYERAKELKDKFDAGKISRKDAVMLLDKAKKERDVELKAIADAAEAEEQLRLKKATKKRADKDKELERIATQMNKELQDSLRYQSQKTISVIRQQQYEANKIREIEQKKTADFKAAQREAQSILDQYASPADRAAVHLSVLEAHFRSGAISADNYATAVDRINQRQRAMAGGMGRMSYVLGNTLTGFEDFVTVISMTGFGMDGFAAATRSASNNLGQAVRGLGSAASAIAAPMVSIGAVLIGFAIPAIYRWATGAENAEKETRKLEQSVEDLKRSLTSIPQGNILAIEREMMVNDIKKMEDTKAIDEKIKKARKEQQIIENQIASIIAEMQTNAIGAINKAMGQGVRADFNNLATAIGSIRGEGVRKELENKFNEINAAFIEESVEFGGPQARAAYENRMREFSAAIEKITLDIMNSNEASPELEGKLKDAAGIFDRNAMLSNRLALGFDEAEVIDAIQAMEEKIVELNKQENEQHKEAIKNLKTKQLELEALLAQQKVADQLAREELKDRILKENAEHELRKGQELEQLQIQNKKNTLIGKQHEAEAAILDLALRRRELLLTNLAPPAVLEGMFDAELRAKKQEIELKLAESNKVTGAGAISSQAEAYATINRVVQGTMGKEDEDRRQMIKLLDSINNHLAGKQLFNLHFN